MYTLDRFPSAKTRFEWCVTFFRMFFRILKFDRCTIAESTISTAMAEVRPPGEDTDLAESWP